MGALRVGSTLRATEAGGNSRCKKDGVGGTGDAGTEGVGAAASGERATEAPAVEETVWDRSGEEGRESHDYFEDLTQTLSKRECYVRSQHAHINKGKARSKIKYYIKCTIKYTIKNDEIPAVITTFHQVLERYRHCHFQVAHEMCKRGYR